MLCTGRLRLIGTQDGCPIAARSENVTAHAAEYSKRNMHPRPELAKSINADGCQTIEVQNQDREGGKRNAPQSMYRSTENGQPRIRAEMPEHYKLVWRIRPGRCRRMESTSSPSCLDPKVKRQSRSTVKTPEHSHQNYRALRPPPRKRL